MNFNRELEASLEIIKFVRDNILRIYNSNFDVEIKDDNSPVTEADKQTDKAIREFLLKKFPNYGMLTEESKDNLSRLGKDFVFVIDPIDGTKNFVAKDGEFTVDIGLSYKHKPVIGVILIPVTGEIYYAAKGQGAFYLKDYNCKPVRIHCSSRVDNLRAVISKCHFNELEKQLLDNNKDKIVERKQIGSTIKGCLIAKGEAEYHCRFSSNTKEWDTCAMQCVVEEAGGFVLDLEGKPIVYNRKDVYNRGGYIICNKKENFIK